MPSALLRSRSVIPIPVLPRRSARYAISNTVAITPITATHISHHTATPPEPGPAQSWQGRSPRTGPELAARFDRGAPPGDPAVGAHQWTEDSEQDEEPESDEQCDHFQHPRRTKPRCLVCPFYRTRGVGLTSRSADGRIGPGDSRWLCWAGCRNPLGTLSGRPVAGRSTSGRMITRVRFSGHGHRVRPLHRGAG